MFLPGQIENWVVINNMNKLSLSSLPKKEMKKVIEMLQTNYMYVLGKIFNFNCTGFQKMCWNLIEIFVDRETAEKITFYKESAPLGLINSFHPSQLEKRFGGIAETPKQYWPPIIPAQTFRGEGEEDMNIVSDEEYKEILIKNPLLRQK